jgi:cobalamin biosynthesis protein CobT
VLAVFDTIELAQIEAHGAHAMTSLVMQISALIEDKYYHTNHSDMRSLVYMPFKKVGGLLLRKKLTSLATPLSSEKLI